MSASRNGFGWNEIDHRHFRSGAKTHDRPPAARSGRHIKMPIILAEQADRAANPGLEIASTTDEDILVVEEDMTLPLHTPAAERADYRQLFKNLRYND